MPAVFKVQSNFNLGELNKALFARADFEGYYKGVRRALNVLGTHQGGLLRRFGTEFSFEITGVTTAEEIAFENIDLLGDVYLLVFRPNFIDIYFDDVLQQTLATPYAAAQIPTIEIQKLVDTLIIVQGETPIQELTPVVLPNSWTLTPVTLKFQPTFDFLNNYSSIDFTPSAVSGDTVTLTASAPIFSTDFIGGLFEGNGGTLRLETFNSDTEMVGRTLEDFINTNAIPGDLASLREPIFSVARGFPRTVGFTQERLILAGTRSIPSLVAFSVTNDYFNYDEGTGIDSDAIVTFTTPVDNQIRHVFDTNALLIFGDKATLATPLTYEIPLTPSNIFYNTVDTSGVSDLEPFEIDNQVVFVDSGGKIVKAAKFAIDQNSFRTNNLSALSSQLIKSPIHSGILRNPSQTDTPYVFLINDDGTVATFHSLTEQNIAGWTELDTPGGQGKFVNVTNFTDEVWFLTERIIDGNTRFFVEKINYALFTDMTLTFTFGVPTTTVTGLSIFEGETVQVRGDGYVLEEEVVTGGQIEISRASTEVEVGLGYFPLIIPMPNNINTQLGPDLYFRKRSSSIYVDYIDSLGIFVEDILVPDLKFSPLFFPGQPPKPRDGFNELTIFNADWWNPRAEIRITQKDPLPMHIIGIGQEIQSEELIG